MSVKLAKRSEAKLTEQRAQTPTDGSGRQIMENAESEVGRAQRLPPSKPRKIQPAVVELVGVEVEYCAPALPVILSQGSPQDPTRQDPEVAAPRDREPAAPDLRGRERKLP